MIDASAFESAAAEALAIQNQTGFPPALDDRRLATRYGLLWFPIEGAEPLDRLIRMQRPGDPITRAVVGSVLHVLITDNTTGEGDSILRDSFRRFVDSVSIANLSDPALLRWENHVAAVAGSLERVLEIARRLELIGTTADVRALLARTLFLLVHPSSRTLEVIDTPSALDPLIHAPQWDFHHVSDFLTYLLATTVEKRGELDWREPGTFTSVVLDALIVIDTMLRQIRNATEPLTPTQRAIQSWVWFAEGAAAGDTAKLNQAGNSYETLSKHPLDSDLRLTGSEPATRCFGLAGNWSAALDASRKWASQVPQAARAHERRAEAHYKLGQIPEAIQAFEQCLGLRTDLDNDWQSSLLLKLGLEANVHRSAAFGIESAAFSASIRPQGERLVAWYHPWFDALSRSAQKRWWVGMYSVSSPHVAMEMGPERWDIAADSFGEAVAFELKERIFIPFAATAPLSPPDEFWKRVLAGRGTLGQMIRCLREIRTSEHRTVQQFSRWLTDNHPHVVALIHSRQAHRLSRMATLRGAAQHESVTEAETREIFKEAADLLNAMAGR